MVGSDGGEMTHPIYGDGRSDRDRSVGSSAGGGQEGRGSGSFRHGGVLTTCDLLVLVYMVKQTTLSISLQ